MSFFDAYSPFQRLLGKKKIILYSSLPLQPLTTNNDASIGILGRQLLKREHLFLQVVMGMVLDTISLSVWVLLVLKNHLLNLCWYGII